MKIEFLDAQGNVIRAFTGDSKPGTPPAATARAADLRRPAAAGRREEGHEPVHVEPALAGRGVREHDHVGGAPQAARPRRRRTTPCA